jgi:hypothetical protein
MTTKLLLAGALIALLILPAGAQQAHKARPLASAARSRNSTARL